MAKAKSTARTKKQKKESGGRYTQPLRHAGTATGKYLTAEARGSYTPPVGKNVRQSPPWYGPFIIALFVLGLLVITLNYLGVLPGATSVWYLLAGVVLIFMGFAAMMRYH